MRFDAMVRYLAPLTALRQLEISINNPDFFLDAEFSQLLPPLDSVIHLVLILLDVGITHHMIRHQLPIAAVFPNLQALHLGIDGIKCEECNILWRRPLVIVQEIDIFCTCFTTILASFHDRLNFPHLREVAFKYYDVDTYDNIKSFILPKREILFGWKRHRVNDEELVLIRN